MIQFLINIYIYIYIKAIQLNHSFGTPLFREGDTISGSRNVRYRVRLPWWGIWTEDVICAELGVIQRKFIFYMGWLRMNLNELIYHLRTILNCTWQSLRQQGPRQDFVCVSVGQGVPLQEAAVVTRRLRLCWPLLSQRALQDPQLDHELTTQFTGQHLTI